MPDSIKKQIMNRVMSNLAALVPDSVRLCKRALDPLQSSDQMPSVFVYDGEETQLDADNRGRTFMFTLGVKVLLEDPQDLAAAKDDLVPKVQQLIENDIQLNGLANIVDGGAEQPFLNELGKPIGGAFLTWTIQYRRYLGNPYATY